MSLLDMINALGEWVLSNFDKVLFPVSTIIIRYVVYGAISREITNLGIRRGIQLLCSTME